MKENKKFAEKVLSCEGSFTTSTVYADGGQQIEHGAWENDPCTCGLVTHYSSPQGEVFNDLGEYNVAYSN